MFFFKHQIGLCAENFSKQSLYNLLQILQVKKENSWKYKCNLDGCKNTRAYAFQSQNRQHTSSVNTNSTCCFIITEDFVLAYKDTTGTISHLLWLDIDHVRL